MCLLGVWGVHVRVCVCLCVCVCICVRAPACACVRALNIKAGRVNEKAYRMGGKATITSDLRLGASEVPRRLKRYLRTQSRGHHTVDRLEEKGVERGSARRSYLRGRERAIVSQMNIGTLSKATSESRTGSYMRISP